jgi:hypothetical protein
MKHVSMRLRTSRRVGCHAVNAALMGLAEGVVGAGSACDELMVNRLVLDEVVSAA